MIVDRRRVPRISWQKSPWRIAGFTVVVIIAVLALIIRLVQVQVMQGEAFRAAAQANQIRLIEVAAPRGMIRDRNGNVMVRSRPSFVVGLIPSEVTDVKGELHTLASILGVPESSLW